MKFRLYPRKSGSLLAEGNESRIAIAVIAEQLVDHHWVPITRIATNRRQRGSQWRSARSIKRRNRNRNLVMCNSNPREGWRKTLIFPSHSPRPLRMTRCTGGDPEESKKGEGRGKYARAARGTARFHCLRSGARAPPPTPRTHNPLSLASLYPDAPSRRDFFFSRRGPTFIINALGPLRGQIEAKARTGRPVFASQRGSDLHLPPLAGHSRVNEDDRVRGRRK